NYVIRVIDSKRQLIDLSLSQEEVNKLRKKKREKQFELKKLRKYAGLVFQFPEYQLFEESVLKDVMFGPKNFGIKDEEAKKLAIEALKSCNIDSSYFSRSPFELSGGEKRRVAIAGILALDPEVLVLDEPTAGLDPQGEKEMMALFEKIYESGKSVIIVTHNMDLVLKYARTVVVMSKGEVVKKGDPLDVFVDEELLKNVAIEPPYVIKVALALKEKGIDIDLTKVKDIPSLAKEIGGKIHG
ncbi:MAG: ATP-binding cassette domain-containing protein, partial [Bacilli bacterium]|nr:ATP-binding cassette domain-containing protein [Bacilli bacterium]